MQWLQDLNQSYVDNLNYVRCEASRHFRNKKKECLKAKIDEPETNSKIDLHRSISDFKKGCHPRTNIEKGEKGDLVTDSYSILAGERIVSCSCLNVHGVNDVRQREIHSVEPLMPEPSAFEVEMLTEKPKRHKSPGID